MGLILAVPGFFGSALDPLVGALGDTPRRRALLLAGGLGFAVSAAMTSAAIGFWTLLVALLLGNPATGAFVSLAQATLMDAQPERRELNMARWTLAGSFGYVGGPLLLASAIWLGVGWRGALAALAVAALPLAAVARAIPVVHGDGRSLREGIGYALLALRRRDVLRWLLVLEVADLLGDVLHGFLALYLVDVVGVAPATAALGVATWTAASLIGDAALLPLLRRVEGVRYLRLSALGALVVYPGFLLVPGVAGKLILVAVLGLLNSGWYAIPQAGLYGALEGRSGVAVAVGGIGGFSGAAVPLGLGLAAGGVGLGPTMWLLAAAPALLLLLAPRPR